MYLLSHTTPVFIATVTDVAEQAVVIRAVAVAAALVAEAMVEDAEGYTERLVVQ
jgi:hypothetical protein